MWRFAFEENCQVITKCRCRAKIHKRTNYGGEWKAFDYSFSLVSWFDYSFLSRRSIGSSRCHRTFTLRILACLRAQRFLYEMVHYIKFPYSRTASVSTTVAVPSPLPPKNNTTKETFIHRYGMRWTARDLIEWVRTQEPGEQAINLCAQRALWSFFFFRVVFGADSEYEWNILLACAWNIWN